MSVAGRWGGENEKAASSWVPLVQGKVVVVTGAGAGNRTGICEGLFAAHGAKVVCQRYLPDPRKRPNIAPIAWVEEIKGAGGEAVSAVEKRGRSGGRRADHPGGRGSFRPASTASSTMRGVTRDRFFFQYVAGGVAYGHRRAPETAAFYVARAAAPFFKKQSTGCYVHMTSTSGLVGNLGQANYAAAKMGIVGLSKGIAMDMAKYNVRSNCIAPWGLDGHGRPTFRPTPMRTSRGSRSSKRCRAVRSRRWQCFWQAIQGARVSGQIFGVRANEIYLFTQPRIARARYTGPRVWTPESIGEQAIPALAPSFFANEPSASITPWDPI